MRTRLRPLPLAVASTVVLAVGIGAWSPASQADTTSAACTAVGPNLTDFTATLTLPKFDPTLGTLTAVTISGSEQIIMRIRVENEGPLAYQMGGEMTAVGTLTLPGGETAMTSSAQAHSEMLAAYDGVTDWAGSGFDTGPIADENVISPIQVTGPATASYVGPGTFDSTYIADGNSSFDGPGVSSYWFESTASATVCVSYSYSVATTTTAMPTTTSTTAPPASTTTVPVPTTSTTTPPTTTTPHATTTMAPTTSTTVPCTTAPSTTVPSTTTPPTTAPPSSTSTTTPTTTAPPSSTSTSTTTPAWCAPASTTTSTTTPWTTTTVRPTPITSAPGPSLPTSSATPITAVVSPTTLERQTAVPSIAVAAPTATGTLARTGSEPLSVVLVGAGLLGTGISLMAWRRGQRGSAAA